MIKILQARLQQYANRELPDVQADFRKGRGTRGQIANICWIIKKQESSRKTSISALLTMPKPLTVDHNKLWKILKDNAAKILHSICQQIWKTQQRPQDWKRSVFIPIPKKGNAKECSNYHTIALISHASKVMLKILQARLQQYVNHELPDVQAGFRKGRGTRDQIANICWIMEKSKSSRKTSISALLTMPNPLTVWITINCGKF